MKGKHTIKLDKAAVQDAMERYVAVLGIDVVANELSKIVVHRNGTVTVQLEQRAEATKAVREVVQHVPLAARAAGD
jgi:catechol-2,3-dioxygenase